MEVYFLSTDCAVLEHMYSHLHEWFLASLRRELMSVEDFFKEVGLSCHSHNNYNYSYSYSYNHYYFWIMFNEERVPIFCHVSDTRLSFPFTEGHKTGDANA